MWDIQGKRLRHTLHGHTKDIYSVDFSADGRLVVSGSGDKRAKLWDVNTGECVRTFGDEEGPKDGVTSVAVSPDGRFIAAGSLDRMVRCACEGASCGARAGCERLPPARVGSVISGLCVCVCVCVCGSLCQVCWQGHGAMSLFRLAAIGIVWA